MLFKQALSCHSLAQGLGAPVYEHLYFYTFTQLFNPADRQMHSTLTITCFQITKSITTCQILLALLWHRIFPEFKSAGIKKLLLEKLEFSTLPSLFSPIDQRSPTPRPGTGTIQLTDRYQATRLEKCMVFRGFICFYDYFSIFIVNSVSRVFSCVL